MAFIQTVKEARPMTKGESGEVSGSPGNALADKGKSAALKGDRDDYFMGGVPGLGVKGAGAGSPTSAADLGRKGANRG